MQTQDIPIVASGLIAKMSEDGYYKKTIETTRWMTDLFYKYCLEKELETATISDAVRFFDERFSLDYYGQLIPAQAVIRKPLLNLFEYEDSGNYLRFHPKSRNTTTPIEYKDVFMAFRDYISKLELAYATKSRKIWEFSRHLEYLVSQGITDTHDISVKNVFDYFAFLKDHYTPATLATLATVIREIYDWMFERGEVSFSGTAAIPYIKRDRNRKMLSYYTKEEIGQMLSCIDNCTAYGKFAYAIVSLITYLGIRAGDVIRLKFSDVDWNKSQLHFIQNKTGKPLVLPLLDEVKYPLLDYIKNARPESTDTIHVFVSFLAPHKRYVSTASIHKITTSCMEIAGIQYEGRHHGPHALRHSLATRLMNQNVPISAISSVLGHSSTRSTEKYLTVDETHLKEFTLEVPHAN